MRKHFLSLFLFFIIWNNNTFSQSGALDPTFGTNGIATTDINLNSWDNGSEIAIQSDGKILVAGYINKSGEDFALVRYNNDGSLDNSFGTLGIVQTSMNPESGFSDEEVKDLKIQSDGKILLIGAVYTNNTDRWEFAIARYNSDGTLDNSFDTDGKAITEVGGGYGGGYRIGESAAIQADGKIVVTGNYFDGHNKQIIIRYNFDGSLDNSFGTNGKIFLDLFDLYSIVVQNDGKIVAAGEFYNGTDSDFGIVRLNQDGSLDNSFDSNGSIISDLSYDENEPNLIVLSDGKYLLIGIYYDVVDIGFIASRYNTNGTLDNTFGTAGRSIVPFSITDCYGVCSAIQNNNKIVIGGSFDNGTNYDMGLTRLNSDGSIDYTFDTDGKVETDIGNTNNLGYAVAIQSDGKIVLSGKSYNGTDMDFAIVRYIGDVVGIEDENKINNFNVFPNPTTGKFKIENKELRIKKVETYNTIGEIIYNSESKNQIIEIDLSNNPSGIYFAKIYTDEGVSVKKIILEK